MTATDVVRSFLEHVDRGCASAALDLVSETAAAGASVTSVVRGHLAPAQRIVGERWQRGTYTVAEEHRASAVVEDALGLLRQHLPRTSDAPRIALVCAIDEWHVTPARMAALILAEAGWQVDLFGASTPADHLRQALALAPPQVLGISATLPLSLRGVPPLVEVARALDVPVMGGGAAFGDGGHRARTLGLHGHAPDAESAARMMTGWLDIPPATPPAALHGSAVAEQLSLRSRREHLVARTLGRLERHLAGLDRRQQDDTRREVVDTLQFLETALLVDDPALFTQYLVWLRSVRARRGMHAKLLSASLAVLVDVVGDEHPAASLVLSEAVDGCLEA